MHINFIYTCIHLLRNYLRFFTWWPAWFSSFFCFLFTIYSFVIVTTVHVDNQHYIFPINTLGTLVEEVLGVYINSPVTFFSIVRDFSWGYTCVFPISSLVFHFFYSISRHLFQLRVWLADACVNGNCRTKWCTTWRI